MKLIRESLGHNFTRGGVDKLTNLNLGKVKRIKDWLDETGVTYYEIHDDYRIDASCDPDFRSYLTGSLPDFIQFGCIYGDFTIEDCKMTTLRGCPLFVNGNFYCGANELKSLEGGPDTVTGGYYCGGNLLKTLEFCPDYVGADFACDWNKLKDLKFAPVRIDGNFIYGGNKISKEELQRYKESGSVKGDFLKHDD